MKKIVKYFLLIIILLPLLFISDISINNHSKKHTKDYYSTIEPLDFIESYNITVDVNEDGSLNMNYNISWIVLDDKTEGPLSWVKIGIPNMYIKNLTPITSNIDKIKYYSDDGSFIKIDFDRKYYKNEKVNFEFSFTQERMYQLLENDLVYYNFVPGWFDEIRVGMLTVKWNNKNVIDSNHQWNFSGYLQWNENLDYGESLEIEVLYNKNSFLPLSEDLQYTDRHLTNGQLFAIISVIAFTLIFFIVLIIVSIKNYDPYMSNRGFVGRKYLGMHYYHHYYGGSVDSKGVTLVNKGSSGSGISGSSCACACACAGGGRAGCSRKDFNHSNINSEKLINMLKKKSSS